MVTKIVEFKPEACGRSWLRARRRQVRTVSVAEYERLQQRLRKLVVTPKG